MNINEIMKTAKMGNPEESFNFSKKNEALDKAIDSFTRASTGEETSIVLNEYFTKILDIIRDFGGDVIKFAGDALLVMWKSHVVTTNESFEELMHHAKVRSSYLEAMTNAYACSKEIQATCDNYRPQGKEAKGIILRNKITITAGEISGFYIGGVGDRMEYFIAGTPLEEIGDIADRVQPGETIVHSDVYVQLSQLSTSGFKFSEKEGSSNMWLLRDCPRKDRSPLELPVRTNPKFFDIVGQYLPSVVKANLNGQITQAKAGSQPILAELRRVSIMFVMFTGMTYRGAQALKQVQDVITACQKTLYRFDGSLRQFLVEDKGSVLIAAFGVPPHGTENFAWRAVSAAMEVRFTLDELNVSCSIGVTTGNVFCGNIGSKDRCEYSYVGDVVNMSARLMQKAQFHGYILVDEDTQTATKDSIQYHPKITLKIKGKNTSVTAYPPKLNKNSLKGVMNDLNAGVQEPTQEANDATLFGRTETIASLHKLLPQARKNGV
jgi:class 3 adenylate cyclase